MKMTRKRILWCVATLAVAGIGMGAATRNDPFADIEVRVLDDIGKPVEDVAVTVCFEFFNQSANAEVKGITDESGSHSVHHRAQNGRVFVSLEKAGHYPTKGYVQVRDFPDKAEEYEKAFARDRWSEQPAMAELVLKRILNPKQLELHYCLSRMFPVVGEPFAIDLETLEWCPPYGNGKHKDATLVYETWKNPTNRLSFLRKLTVSMPNAADGFYSRETDPESAFPYEYCADTNETFRKEGVLLFDRRSGRIDTSTLPGPRKYFVFRTRTETNSEGRVTSAHYGRLGEDADIITGLKAAVWFNPDDNDTNLEDGWHH